MSTAQQKKVAIWLGIVCSLIFCMVIVGGITRLTHSGLSMVEWKPLMGAIPPMSDEAWNETFSKYKNFPEYKIMNRNMELPEFKFIFYWEYFHRLIGRLIGVIYLLPFLYFYFRNYFDKKWAVRIFTGFLLGGLQGFMGWFMVKSGLVDNPHVSHYRLAAHLSIAFGIAGYLFWLILDLLYADQTGQKKPAVHKRFRQSLLLTLGVCLQIIYGAFTAGKKAGYGFNTFPKMNDSWFPDEIFSIQPSWLNFLETNAAIQFTHRMIAFSLIIGIPLFLWIARFDFSSPAQKISRSILFVALLVQFSLGVLTILFIGDFGILLPSIHQCGAFFLFLSVINFNYVLYKNK
ncbi:MAG: COX15/CtaA family protein [Spirochaetia bacterium]|nr:COX15/CtaA family protein [Spirochaetia bacterium]